MPEKKEKLKCWAVEFPTYRYNENVVELARANGLRVINKNHVYPEDEHREWVSDKDAPKLTLKDEYKPKVASKAAAKKPAAKAK